MSASGRKNTVRDLWKHKDIGSTKDKMQFDIPAHGVVLLKLTPKQ